jgi:hypothetical protein
MGLFKLRLNACYCAVLECNGKDGVAVAVIADKLIVIAVAGRCNQFSCLIAV